MMKDSARRPPMAAAKEPTTSNRTGTWRFERPVFVNRLAPCSQACPMGEDIPTIMALDRRADFEPAYRKIKEENPFPGICGRICFHPCERVCNRGRLDEPVSIRDLEWSTFKFHQRMLSHAPISNTGHGGKAAVIGGGFAGLSCTYFLARLGYEVTLFCERALEEILVPPLEQRDVEQEIAEILGLGIEVRREVVDPGSPREGLIPEYKAVYAAPGDEADPSRKAGAPVAHPSGALFLDESRAAGPFQKTGDISRRIVRLIAAGKRGAMLLDSSLRDMSLKTFARGRLGALSFEAYRLGIEALPKETVGPENLNLSRFEKKARLHPASPNGSFNRARAVASSARCFNCGMCTFCMDCYDYCPDLSIRMDAQSKTKEIDYDHCKGCGICAEECPRGAIDWVKEESTKAGC